MHANTDTHACRHTHTGVQIHARVHRHADTDTHTCSHVHRRTGMQIQTHIRAHSHRRVDTDMHADTQACKHRHTGTIHTDARRHTQAQALTGIGRQGRHRGRHRHTQARYTPIMGDHGTSATAHTGTHGHSRALTDRHKQKRQTQRQTRQTQRQTRTDTGRCTTIMGDQGTPATALEALWIATGDHSCRYIHRAMPWDRNCPCDSQYACTFLKVSLEFRKPVRLVSLPGLRNF